MSFAENFLKMEARLRVMEEKFAELGYHSQRLVETTVKRQYKIEQQPQTLWAPIIGYVVDTIDPQKLQRVRFFSPFLHEPNSKISELPFARHVSPFGGHDDCGTAWVPPAGSTVVIVHENGDRSSPLYLGTTYHGTRGADGNAFPYPILEFQKLYCDRGEGYLVGDTDGSQVYPPWNTENYNGYDIESDEQFENDPEAQKKITYPHIYGFKTPGKHYQKYDDGDYRCQNRWRRMEWGSAGGQWMMFKDDHLHPGGQWANPKCGAAGSAPDECLDVSALLDEQVQGQEDADGNFIGAQIGDCIQNSKGEDCRISPKDDPECANPYFKREDECRPYKGAPTPQNNKLKLPQSGYQVQSRSGQQFVMDDSVNKPKGKKLRWQDDFNFGCDNIFKGKMFMKSATGHFIGMDDMEEVPEIRGKENGIKMVTGAGHRFTMIDHTLDNNIAGENREIILESTSKHILVMHDETNDQEVPKRKEGGIPINKSQRAYVMLRSGYGLLLRMDDNFSQQETQTQALTLMAPLLGADGGVSPDGQAAAAGAPTSSSCQQGHLFRMQLNGSEGGFVITSSGGYYICASIKDNITEVGREECPANKVNMVFGHYITMCKKAHITQSEIELHLADKYIILGAGKDCPPPESGTEEETANEAVAAAQQAITSAQNGEEDSQENQPCFFPVIVAKCPKICPHTGWVHWTEKSMSDRVIASATSCSSGEAEPTSEASTTEDAPEGG
jgi:hypothetical protein